MAPPRAAALRRVDDDEDSSLPPIEVDQTSGEPVGITVDTRTGHTIIEREDGSAEVGPIKTGEKREGPDDEFDRNLAEDEELQSYLPAIALRLRDGIDQDIRDRAEWEATATKGMDLLGIKLEDASMEISAQGSISRTHDTLLLEAVLKNWGNSRAELLPSQGPVKIRDDKSTLPDMPGMGHNGGPPLNGPAPPLSQGQQPPGSMPASGGAPPPGPGIAAPVSREDIARAFQLDFNHYLTAVDRGYYPDFTQMLLSRALIGIAFRKVYRCPILRRPISRWVRGDNLIVSRDGTHIQDAQRVTEKFKVRQSMVRRLQVKGHWADVPLGQAIETASPTEAKVGKIEGRNPMPSLPADHQHEMYECQCELDDGPLAKDETGEEPGYPLPYVVTMDKEGRNVVALRRNWRKGDEDHQKRQRYVKYGMVPGFGFYDIGFVHILGNSQRATTAILRNGIDTGMLNSFPGGLIQKGPGDRSETTQIRVGPGEFKVINTGGTPIKDWAIPLPYKEPSNVLMQVGQSVQTNGRRLAGTLDLPVGEGRADVPVGTMMAFIEMVTKVPSAVHKDDHTAQQEEFELLRELFLEEPESLTKLSKRPERRAWTEEEFRDVDLVPAADPNVPSQTHRVLQASGLAQASGLPQFQGVANAREVWNEVVRTLGYSSPERFSMPPQPPQQAPPDPKVIAALMKAKDSMEKRQADLEKEQLRSADRKQELAIESTDRQADRDSEERRAAMALEGERLRAAIGHVSDVLGHVQTHAQHLDELGEQRRQHGVDTAEAARQHSIDTHVALNPPQPPQATPGESEP